MKQGCRLGRLPSIGEFVGKRVRYKSVSIGIPFRCSDVHSPGNKLLNFDLMWSKLSGVERYKLHLTRRKRGGSLLRRFAHIYVLRALWLGGASEKEFETLKTSVSSSRATDIGWPIAGRKCVPSCLGLSLSKGCSERRRRRLLKSGRSC